MIGSRARLRSRGEDSSWPGFVDALSTLLLAIIFLLSLFVLSQFFLNQALSGREQALSELRAQVLDLGNLLKLEQQASADLRDSLASLTTSLNSANSERDQLSADLTRTQAALAQATGVSERLQRERDALQASKDSLDTRVAAMARELTEEKALSSRSQDEVARLRSSLAVLQDQLARLETALSTSEDRDKQNQAAIVDLGRRLNRALASKVEELASYRSEFFGRLRDVLAARPEIRVEGDRFVFQSELLFQSGSADLGSSGRAELRAFADTLLEISRNIPAGLDWVLRVDGHTDRRPIYNQQFRSNWHLSAQRAIAVVEFLIASGIPPERLAATGFGEFQPLDDAETPAAFARNRRIEMRLTQR